MSPRPIPPAAAGATRGPRGSAAGGGMSPALALEIDRYLSDPSRSYALMRPEFSIDYQVDEVRDGRVYLTFSLPVGLTHGFMTLLGSMHGFMHQLDRLTAIKRAELKAHDPDEINKRREFQAHFTELCLEHFDRFISQGCTKKEALSRTNEALKSENHPWASYALVRDQISASGRLRKKKAKGGETEKT